MEALSCFEQSLDSIRKVIGLVWLWRACNSFATFGSLYICLLPTLVNGIEVEALHSKLFARNPKEDEVTKASKHENTRLLSIMSYLSVVLLPYCYCTILYDWYFLNYAPDLRNLWLTLIGGNTSFDIKVMYAHYRL